ncbi:MAG: SHOCT domain-containing protein [Syntrophotaleaceae bacterium]
MTHKGQLTPGGQTVLQAKIGIVVVAFFLLFGLVFGFVVLQETPDSEGSLKLLIGLFFLIWVVACLGIIVFYTRLMSKRGSPTDNSLVDIHLESTAGFDERLRALEALKSDGLLSEEEYRAKREQILKQPW